MNHYVDELPAKSPPAWVWFGFVFAFVLFVGEVLDALLDLNHEMFRLVLILVLLAGWFYWLFCVYRFHSILRELSRNHYPITGPEAIGKHFIPLYNFYWLFKWPDAFSKYINRRARVRMVSGGLLGGLLLLSVLVSRFFDSAVGLAGIFTVGMYMSAKLRRHMELVKGLAPGMLPPPPDASMFRADLKGSEQSEARVEVTSTDQGRNCTT